MWYLNAKLAAVQIGRDGRSCVGESVEASRTVCVCVRMTDMCQIGCCVFYSSLCVCVCPFGNK